MFSSSTKAGRVKLVITCESERIRLTYNNKQQISERFFCKKENIMSMQQQITLTWFLLLSTTIYMTTGFTRDTHLKWLVQRTLHHDRIKHLPSDIRCSDIQNARIDADSGDCVCPRDHVFHFMKNGIASCLSEQTICKGNNLSGSVSFSSSL